MDKMLKLGPDKSNKMHHITSPLPHTNLPPTGSPGGKALYKTDNTASFHNNLLVKHTHYNINIKYPIFVFKIIETSYLC